MPQSRLVRIFISSTFRDFMGERDELVKKVFPELRSRCKSRFVELLEVDLRWGGHKCAQDWWWQYVLHRKSFASPPQSCAAKCLYALDQKQAGRASFTDPAMANFTPKCKDWDERWPPLDASLRPPDAHRASLFAPFV